MIMSNFHLQKFTIYLILFLNKRLIIEYLRRNFKNKILRKTFQPKLRFIAPSLKYLFSICSI